MNDTPPDWVLIEAAKRSEWYNPTAEGARKFYSCTNYTSEERTFRALCDMIQKYEQPPVDRKLLCVMEAWRPLKNGLNHSATLDAFSIRCIELWEEGFGRD